VGTLFSSPLFVNNLLALTALFGIATSSYQAFSVTANVLPSNPYQPDGVATVSGPSGTAAGTGTILGFKAIGYFSDTRSAAGMHALLKALRGGDFEGLLAVLDPDCRPHR